MPAIPAPAGGPARGCGPACGCGLAGPTCGPAGPITPPPPLPPPLLRIGPYPPPIGPAPPPPYGPAAARACAAVKPIAPANCAASRCLTCSSHDLCWSSCISKKSSCVMNG